MQSKPNQTLTPAQAQAIYCRRLPSAQTFDVVFRRVEYYDGETEFNAELVAYKPRPRNSVPGLLGGGRGSGWRDRSVSRSRGRGFRRGGGEQDGGWNGQQMRTVAAGVGESYVKALEDLWDLLEEAFCRRVNQL
jgi:hypothetical protein